MKEVLDKLKFKEPGVIINSPHSLEKEFVNLKFITSFNKNEKSRNSIIFVNNNKELINFLSTRLGDIEYDSVLWIAYPKGSSGIRTDINRDILRTTAEGFGLSTVTAVSIDNTWSALRLRPAEKVGKKVN